MSRDFWSRRREAVAAETRTEVRAAEQAQEAVQQAELEALSDEELLAKYDLADPDTLDNTDAVKDFLTHSLPQRLKTRALRRLWRLNPVLANVDGLVDYGEDFTDAATVIEGLQTAYQVGKGMLAHVEQIAEQLDEADKSETEEEEVEEIPPLIELAEPAPLPDYEESEAPAAPSLNRRMTFHFESAT
jgi:hypothetical protein